MDSRLQGKLYRKFDEHYIKISEIFNDILNHHAPLIQKQVRGNHALFMTKDLSKKLMNTSKAKSQYWNWLSRENFIFYKRTKKKLILWPKKQNEISSKRPQKTELWQAKTFGVLWNLNHFISNDFIGLENDDNHLIRNKHELEEIFNEHYINILETFAKKNRERWKNHKIFV